MIENAIHYQISDTPIRIAGSEPPYTLINTSLDVTIWLDVNAGLEVGQGTPLNPGTSLVWTRSGEFFARSATNAVMVMSNVEDWDPDPAAIATAILNSGTILVDKPEELFVGDLSAGNSFTTPRIDIARFQSLSIVVQVRELNGTNVDKLTMAFFTDTHPLNLPFDFRILEVTGVSANWGGISGGDWVASIPVSGAAFQLQASTDTLTRVLVVGSHRPQESIQQAIFNSEGQLGGTTDFYNKFVGTIAAGTSHIVPPLSPWFGEIEVGIRYQQTVAAGNVGRMPLLRRSPDTGLFETRYLKAGTNVNAAEHGLRERFTSAGGSWQIGLTALGAQITNANIVITPISGYGKVA